MERKNVDSSNTIVLINEVQLDKKRAATIPAELTEELRKGNHAAFEKLYSLSQFGLKRFLLALTKNNQLAEDIMQEAFLRLWEKREQIDPGKNVMNYLFHVVRSAFINHLRKKEVANKYIQFADNGQAELHAADASMIGEETEILIGLVVAQMPKKRRRIFEMSHYDGLSHKEIADQLGIDTRNVRTQLHYALKEIKNHLETFLAFFIM